MRESGRLFFSAGDFFEEIPIGVGSTYVDDFEPLPGELWMMPFGAKTVGGIRRSKKQGFGSLIRFGKFSEIDGEVHFQLQQPLPSGPFE